MISTDNFLVTGTSGEICGWDWKIITSSKNPKNKVSWTIQLPVNKWDYIIKYKINYLIIIIFNDTIIYF